MIVNETGIVKPGAFPADTHCIIILRVNYTESAKRRLTDNTNRLLQSQMVHNLGKSCEFTLPCNHEVIAFS